MGACGPANCAPSLATAGGNCSLGRLSAFYVDAKIPADVSATMAFVKMHNIRMIIKNTGHDYYGRSAASNTLTLRMSNMKTMEFHSSFQANLCPAASGTNIGVIGAEVIAQDAVEFFLNHNMDVTVGSCPSVGIAGGLGQGGGHGPFSPSRGLMVDQAVEFDVVTADGIARTINECNDPDLFWAMCGGGGGTYALLTSYKFKVYPKVQLAVFHFWANIKDGEITPNITQSKILRDTWTAIASNQTIWSENGIAGYDFLIPNSVEFLEILPAAGDPMSVMKNLTADFSSFLSNNPSLDIITNEYILYENQAAFALGRADIFARRGPIGVNIFVPSRLVSRSLFKTPKSIKILVEAALRGMERVVAGVGIETASLFNIGLFKTAAVHSPDTARATSANSAWRDAFWHVISGAAWPPGTPDDVIAATQSAARDGLEEIKAVLPYQAAYTNEADFGEPDWQNVYFGTNYAKLASIKKKYDPTTLLNAWKTVGFLGEAEQMYSCYGNHPNPSLPGL